MTAFEKKYSYKKGLRIVTYTACLIVMFAAAGAIAARIRGERDIVTFLLWTLVLLIPLSALVTVRTRFVVTNEGLTKISPLGRRIILWSDIKAMREKEGFFQRIVTVVDKNDRKIVLPYEQIEEGRELYARVKQMIVTIS